MLIDAKFFLFRVSGQTEAKRLRSPEEEFVFCICPVIWERVCSWKRQKQVPHTLLLQYKAKQSKSQADFLDRLLSVAVKTTMTRAASRRKGFLGSHFQRPKSSYSRKRDSKWQAWQLEQVAESSHLEL